MMSRFIASILFCLAGTILCLPVFVGHASDYLPLPSTGKLDVAMKTNRLETDVTSNDYKEIIFSKGDKGLVSKKNFRTASMIIGAMAIAFLVILGGTTVASNGFGSGTDESIDQTRKTLKMIIVGLVMVSASFFIGAMLMNTHEETPGVNGDTAYQSFVGKLDESMKFIPFMFAGIAMVMITIAGINLVVRGDQDDAVQKEKAFIRSFLIGFGIFLLGLAIAQIASFNKRTKEMKDVSFDETIKKGFNSGDAVESSRNAVSELIGIVDFILSFIAVSSLLMLVIAGLYYVINFGNEEQTSRAKRIIIACIVALIVSFSAYTLFRIFF